MKMKTEMQKDYAPPMVKVIRVALEEGLAQGVARCSPINPGDIMTEEWVETPDVYGDIYILDTW